MQKSENIPYFETSAKDYINVNEVFEKIAEDAYEYKSKNIKSDNKNKIQLNAKSNKKTNSKNNLNINTSNSKYNSKNKIIRFKKLNEYFKY